MAEWHRVVITGLGVITPLGHNVADTWRAILAGESGLGPYTLVHGPDHIMGGICEVKEFEPTDYIDRRRARRRDRSQLLATVAAEEAMKHAGLEITDENREKIGVYLGTGIGGTMTLVEQDTVRREKGIRRMSPFAVTMIMPNGASGMLSIDFGIQGPSPTVTTACAAGCDAIGAAYKAIRYGELVAVLSGGFESTLIDTAIGGFEKMGATSEKSEKTPSPFDKNRDGLIIGEGAGMVVLESLEHAQARGATILAEVVGYGQTSDAHHITAPAEGGLGAARAMRIALADAGLEPEDVDYINAHGTATPMNDEHETMAIKQVLGDHAYKIPISSTKSMTGHILGATGAIETVFSTLVLQEQVVPPTINYETPDPICDLDYVPNEARAAKVDVVMNNAFGFGGHNAVLIFKRYQA
ncbi:MAG TPA: beta-ketoacyl-ACP synthase II [Anaerolineae bacterium]|nr:beta-ketoacyl-ACP synthase II [Anaerolineae bacterium]